MRPPYPRLGSARPPRASGWPALEAAGSHRSARTGRVAGDGQPARLELLGGRLLGVHSPTLRCLALWAAAGGG
jgi:hypothetical protein